MGSMVYINEGINSALNSNHIFFLNGEIDEVSVGEAIKWIIYENILNKNGVELTLYINTSGGTVSDAFALIDVMKASSLPIKTIGIGAIHSAGFLIFAAGTPGKRVISKNASVMIHQYTTGFLGKQHEIKAQIRELEMVESRIIDFLSEVTGYDSHDVKDFFLPPTDVWLNPAELISYKIADKVGE